MDSAGGDVPIGSGAGDASGSGSVVLESASSEGAGASGDVMEAGGPSERSAALKLRLTDRACSDRISKQPSTNVEDA